MIDWHTHILPGIDDGATTIDESLSMARSLSDFGYKQVCCTPHCMKGYYDLTPEQVREATLMLQADLDNADIHLELWPGMEYMLDECFTDYSDHLLTLGNTKLILCEAPQQAHSGIVQDNLKLIIEKGFVPLVAHPERTEFFYNKLWAQGSGQRDMGNETLHPSPFTLNPKKTSFWSRLFKMKTPSPLTLNPEPNERDIYLEHCLFHANIGSFTGYYGSTPQSRAYELLKLGVYTAIASDLHESRGSSKVLQRDKIETNPLLKKLADWDGTVDIEALHKDQMAEKGVQKELF